jgi:hypothetical protein
LLHLSLSLSPGLLSKALPVEIHQLHTTPSCCWRSDPETIYFRCSAGSEIGGRHQHRTCARPRRCCRLWHSSSREPLHDLEIGVELFIVNNLRS